MEERETVRRTTGRMLAVRADGRVLLLRGRDPHHPERPFFITVGGGVDPGESHRDAAVRELFEETGIVVDPAAVSGELKRYSVVFSWAGQRVEQELVYFAVGVPDDAAATFAGLDGDELDSIESAHWLSPDELAAHEDHDGDERLVDLLRAAVTAVLSPD